MIEGFLEDARVRLGPMERLIPPQNIREFNTLVRAQALMEIGANLPPQELHVSDPEGRLFRGLGNLMRTAYPVLSQMVALQFEGFTTMLERRSPAEEYRPIMAAFGTAHDMRHGAMVAARHLLIATQMGNMDEVVEIMTREGVKVNASAPEQIGPRTWRVVRRELDRDHSGDESLRNLTRYLKGQPTGPEGIVLPHQTRISVIAGVDFAREVLALVMRGSRSSREQAPN